MQHSTAFSEDEISPEDIWGAYSTQPAVAEETGRFNEKDIKPEDIWGPRDDFGVPKGNVSRGDYLTNEAKKTIMDTLSIPGLAVDAIGMAYNSLSDLTNGALPPVAEFVWGSKDLQDQFYGLVGVKTMEAPDKETEQMGTFIKYALPSILTGPAMAMAQGLSKAGRIKTLFTELAFGAGSGTGAVLGREVADDNLGNKEVGEIIGSLAGIGTSAGIAGAVNKAWGGTQGGINVAQKEMSGLNKAEKKLQKEMDKFEDSNANLIKSRELSDNIPGFKGDLAQNAQNPGLRSITLGLASNDSKFYADLMNLNKADAEAIATKLNTFLPQTQRDAIDLPKGLYKKVDRKLKSQVKKTEVEIDRISDLFMNKPTPAIGKRLRELRTERLVAAKKLKDLKYTELYAEADKVNLAENMTPFYNAAARIFKDADFQEGHVPRMFKKILKDYKPKEILPDTAPKKPPVFMRYKSRVEREAATKEANDLALIAAKGEDVYVAFKEFHSLSKKLKEDLQGADPTKAKYIRELQDIVKERIDVYTNSAVYGKVADKLKTANIENAKYKQTFFEGVGGNMRRSTEIQDVVADADIVKQVVLSRAGNIAQFKKIYGNSPESKKLLLDGILDIFQDVAKDKATNQITTAGVARFERKYRDVLEELPSVKKMLNNVTLRTKALEGRRVDLANRRKAIDQSRLKKMSGKENTNTLLQNALDNPKEMTLLVKEAKQEKGGIEALARSFADKFILEEDPYMLVNKYKKELAPLFNKLAPGHMQSLNRIFKATSQNKAASVEGILGKKVPKLDTIKEEFGTSPAAIGTRYRDAVAGRINEIHAMTDVAGRYLFTIKQKSMERLLKAALIEPDLGVDLSKLLEKSTFTQNDITTLKKHLATFGLLGAARYDEDEVGFLNE